MGCGCSTENVSSEIPSSDGEPTDSLRSFRSNFSQEMELGDDASRDDALSSEVRHLEDAGLHAEAEDRRRFELELRQRNHLRIRLGSAVVEGEDVDAAAAGGVSSNPGAVSGLSLSDIAAVGTVIRFVPRSVSCSSVSCSMRCSVDSWLGTSRAGQPVCVSAQVNQRSTSFSDTDRLPALPRSPVGESDAPSSPTSGLTPESVPHRVSPVPASRNEESIPQRNLFRTGDEPVAELEYNAVEAAATSPRARVPADAAGGAGAMNPHPANVEARAAQSDGALPDTLPTFSLLSPRRTADNANKRRTSFPSSHHAAARDGCRSECSNATAPPDDVEGAATDDHHLDKNACLLQSVNCCCDEEEECPLCLEKLEEGCEMRHAPCGHFFHRACVDDWLLRARTCPMCQQDITVPLSHPKWKSDFTPTLIRDGETPAV